MQSNDLRELFLSIKLIYESSKINKGKLVESLA